MVDGAEFGVMLLGVHAMHLYSEAPTSSALAVQTLSTRGTFSLLWSWLLCRRRQYRAALLRRSISVAGVVVLVDGAVEV